VNKKAVMMGREQMTSEAIDEVFAKSLIGEYDDDAPWEAVRELQDIGTQAVFEKSVEWCRSTDPLRRARAADVIAQLGKTADHPENALPEDSFIVIASLIKIEADPRPLSSAIYALGHIGNPRAVRILSPFQIHPDAGVRFALACALGCFADDPMAVDALIKLTRDENEDVRDWATFGIGTLSKSDTPAIREALFARIDDQIEDVREEAIAGLVRLKDERVLPALLNALELEDTPEEIVDAALDMLSLSESEVDWTPNQCAAELRKKFGLSR